MLAAGYAHAYKTAEVQRSLGSRNKVETNIHATDCFIFSADAVCRNNTSHTVRTNREINLNYLNTNEPNRYNTLTRQSEESTATGNSRNGVAASKSFARWLHHRQGRVELPSWSF